MDVVRLLRANTKFLMRREVVTLLEIFRTGSNPQWPSAKSVCGRQDIHFMNPDVPL